MDEFDLFPREEAFDPFGVMLFKAMQVLAFLFFIALLSIAPDAKEGKVDPKAEFLITMSWPDNHPDDVDLFVEDPLGNVEIGTSPWMTGATTTGTGGDAGAGGGLPGAIARNPPAATAATTRTPSPHRP